MPTLQFKCLKPFVAAGVGSFYPKHDTYFVDPTGNVLTWKQLERGGYIGSCTWPDGVGDVETATIDPEAPPAEQSVTASKKAKGMPVAR